MEDMQTVYALQGAGVIMEDSRIRVFTGHFGSGKTEVSINYAVMLSKMGMNTCIVDLDIVNPYFSVREVKNRLESYGIRVVSPNIEVITAELSTVPAEVLTAFNKKDHQVVIDVGGDDAGAVALGQYNRYFREEPCDMYFVINTNRPFTGNAEGIIEYAGAIERASRLKIKYLVNNTNMSYETEAEDILKGQEVIKEASRRLNIPIRYTCIREDLAERLSERVEGEILKLKIYMKPVWLEKQ